ncbi:MAG: NAD(P)-dependent alcohol dehydrogenase [Gammaproteobacteria bacterium]|nr:NAD(P)-dependent alcohol dehydrogenase [Gammaproteobacteria bacterium]
MKAVVATQYGSPDILQFAEVEPPTPKENELLIKIHATTVNRTDFATLGGIPFFAKIITGLFKPKRPILGSEFAGEVIAIGNEVTSYKVGDRVFGFNEDCFGSHAQYMTKAEDSSLSSIPEGIDYEQAAASSEGAFYAYNFINKVDLQSGQRVLVNGATGAIGSAAVQLLKYFDADVTAVCGTQNIELVKSLGANRVIDYRKEDFTKDDQRYHCVFDTVGKSSFFKSRHLLKPGGVYISSDLGYMSQNLWLPFITPLIKSLMDNKTAAFPDPKDCREIIQFMKGLMEEGRFKAVIDRVYPFEQIIDAYRYVGQKHKLGNVVITVEHEEG